MWDGRIGRLRRSADGIGWVGVVRWWERRSRRDIGERRWSTLVGFVVVVGRRRIVGLVLGLGLSGMVVEHVVVDVAGVGLVGIGMGGDTRSGLSRTTTF